MNYTKTLYCTSAIFDCTGMSVFILRKYEIGDQFFFKLFFVSKTIKNFENVVLKIL